MITKRDFLQVALASMAFGTVAQSLGRVAASQNINQTDLLHFEPLGQVTLLHITDLHAQLMPLYFREPSINLGVGAAAGLPPHMTGTAFLDHFNITPDSLDAYALTSADFTALAQNYGKVGGIDRLATLIKAIQADRAGKTLFLDGGDTWQGSYTALTTGGADMVRVMNALGVEAMTGHWEFTYGAERVGALIDRLAFPFLAGNVVDTEWGEAVFENTAYFERGGIKIAVIGQAFPYTPIANPSYMIPEWSFGIREEAILLAVQKARAAGAQLVVFLSHNGFDVDRKLASRISGIDVILTGHTHDALPVVIEVGKTLLVASGSHGKFLSRLDLDVDMSGNGIKAFRYKLIPVFADAITADPEMKALVAKIRAPHAAMLDRVLGHTESLLYRRGNFNGSFDDLICQALRVERDAEISLSPGFRWGDSLLPGAAITMEHVYNQTAITYPNTYRSEMSGAFLKNILEDVADNLFNPDPYYQQGGDMVRVGGMGYRIDVDKPMGQRISEMTHLDSGKKIDANRTYIVSGWASVHEETNEQTQEPAIYDLVAGWIEKQGMVSVPRNDTIKLVGG